HWLYARRAEMKMPETVKDTYAQVIKELDAIAKGTLHLGLANAEDVSETGDLLPDVGEYAVRAKQQIDTGGY
ncbi:phage protein Gp36 family protein, partial [Glaesserella parasuis]